MVGLAGRPPMVARGEESRFDLFCRPVAGI